MFFDNVIVQMRNRAFRHDRAAIQSICDRAILLDAEARDLN